MFIWKEISYNRFNYKTLSDRLNEEYDNNEDNNFDVYIYEYEYNED